MNRTKTDNHNPAAKLELRRHFLRQLVRENEPIRVLDCFQGSGLLWNRLRSEFPVAAYWGVDVKPKKGRLKIDSARILEQPGWNQNVIDLDAYGSPWKHFQNLIATCNHSVAVFLTVGMVRIGGGNCGKAALEIAGVRFEKLKLPSALGVKISENTLNHALAAAENRGFQIGEIFEAFPQKNARYIGLKMGFPREKNLQ
ncbi:MAG TPA: hypothetical protein VFM25_03940 [Verrucomicrobiae bacterium]|nr:hypothetical protein [Verrucomicrobiae bacterium]